MAPTFKIHPECHFSPPLCPSPWVALLLPAPIRTVSTPPPLGLSQSSQRGSFKKTKPLLLQELKGTSGAVLSPPVGLLHQKEIQNSLARRPCTIWPLDPFDLPSSTLPALSAPAPPPSPVFCKHSAFETFSRSPGNTAQGRMLSRWRCEWRTLRQRPEP